MFIELTDHLRCPAEHEEAFLVLVPQAVRNRGVASGVLGCPVCQAEYPVREGIAAFAPSPKAARPASGIMADGLRALLGIEGPGGYVVFVGGVAQLAADDADAFAGIGAVLLNPPSGVVDAPPRVSVITAARIPLKSRSVRGVVLGPEYAAEPLWQAEAKRVVLPGRHAVGQGDAPAPPLELLASADGWWVAV